MKSSRSRTGFTLPELIVVIGIIGLLASVVLGNLSQARSKARDAVRRQSLRQLENALDVYYSDNGHYPITLEPGHSLKTCNTSTSDWKVGGYATDQHSWIPGLAPKYISELPKDNLVGSTQICGGHVDPDFQAGAYYYKSCDGENYSLVFYCTMESPVSTNDQFFDSSRPYHTLKLCRGENGCNSGGIY